MPSALFVCLSPLLTYSLSRDAWIFRGIGEKYGPVLTTKGLEREPGARPALEYPAPDRPALDRPVRARPALARPALARPALEYPSESERHGSVPWRGLALSGSIFLAAIFGFLVAWATGSSSLPPLDRHASAGRLAVSFPASWRQQAVPAAPKLGLRDELALVPAAPPGAMLILGLSKAVAGGVLPKSLLATLPQAPTAQIVTLAHTNFYRYLNLSPRGEPFSESVYALPTPFGSILGVCRAPQQDPDLTSACQRVLGTLSLSSGTLPRGPDPSYAVALDAVLSTFNAARSAAETQLRNARGTDGQAAAEIQLSLASSDAGAALLRLHAGSANAANSALAAALRRAAATYVALERAATRGDTGSYRSASASLRRASSAVNSAFSQLRRLGYLVS